MTVATELAKDAQRMEYILCIEGIGWPGDESDFSTAFVGTVFSTGDVNGDLASKLGCTVRDGLIPPSSVYDEIDRRTYAYTASSLSFEVDDVSDVLDDIIEPSRTTLASDTQTLTSLDAALSYQATTVALKASNPGGSVSLPAAGDVVWIGGREAVLLGAKSGTNPATYSSSTRGYLGTPQGPARMLDTYSTSTRSFTADTIVYPRNPYWTHRRVMLLMHVPGEARDNCTRLYTGKIDRIRRKKHGLTWEIQTRQEEFPGAFRVRRGFTPMRLYRERIISSYYTGGAVVKAGSGGSSTGSNNGVWSGAGNSLNDDTASIPLTFQEASYRVIHVDGATFGARQMNEAAFAFTYRTVPGGRAGALNSALTADTTPQAETDTITLGDFDSVSVAYMDCLVSIDGRLYKALYYTDHYRFTMGLTYRTREFLCKAVNGSLGNVFAGHNRQLVTDGEGAEIRFCLDNYTDVVERNRFTVNGEIRRNVVDVALIMMTSFNDEFFIADAASGGNTTTVNFTSPGWSTNQWVGYALHCVEGPNKGESRLITANDSDTITVAVAFSSFSHSGKEYQIRNTIYDVLPSGWCMEVHNSRIDIESWERVRDEFLPNANVSKFAIIGDEIDLWQTLYDNLFSTYGFIPYLDRSTGKLSCRYVGQVTASGLVESFTNIANSELLEGSLTDFDTVQRSPPQSITVAIRGATRGAFRPQIVEKSLTTGAGGTRLETVGYSTTVADNASLSGEPQKITIRLNEVAQHFSEHDRNGLSFSAMFNTAGDMDFLGQLMLQRLKANVALPPETDLYLDLSHLTAVQAGSLLAVTATSFNARDPYTGASSWTQVVCRVLRSEFRLSATDPGVHCRVQVLNPIRAAKIAPACMLVSISGTDFTVNRFSFINRNHSAVFDFSGMAVGDQIAHYSKTGALKSGPYEIDSITSATGVIAVTASISTSFDAGDYVGFYKWVTGSNSSNMENFVALADPTNQEIGTSDLAKEYG